MMTRALMILIAALPLAACTSASIDDPFLNATAAKGSSLALAASASPDHALAGIDGDAPVSVRQTVLDRSAEQTILYANATALEGENALTVAVGPAGSDSRFKGAPSRAQVQTEMRAALGSQPMEIRNEVGENAYGVFGYATGPLGKSGSCLYAWQVARNLMPAGTGSTAYAAQIRLRYCSPSQSSQTIATMMQGLRIKPVSDDTFRMLRLSSGTGALAAGAKPVPVAQTIAAPVTQDIAYTPPIQRTKKHVVQPSPPDDGAKAAEVASSPSVKVPLPGEAAGIAGAAEKADAATPVVVTEKQTATPAVQPSLIPLPATLSVAAQ